MAITGFYRSIFALICHNLIHIVKTNMVNILLRYFCGKIFALVTFAICIEKLGLKCLKECKLLVIRNIM